MAEQNGIRCGKGTHLTNLFAVCNGFGLVNSLGKMSESNVLDDGLIPEWKNMKGAVYIQQLSSRQSLKAKFDKEHSMRGGIAAESSSQFSRPVGNWCDALSSSLCNVNAKQAWKTGTEKLSQTLNNVKTTFGSLSQKLKKSAKKGQPLINVDSPRTPVTPYTKSRVALGRTPTKLYSPFGIDTPTGKENVLYKFPAHKSNSGNNLSNAATKKKAKKTRVKLSSDVNGTFPIEMKFSNELLQTQIGIYEFHSVASRIVQQGAKN